MVKFAHIADCHLGAWRQPELQQLNTETFEKAIDVCISEKVDFVLITGDLFDSAMPSVDILKIAAKKFRELKEKNIECYYIAGSHDYSASGKTFLDVFEKAGLFKNAEIIKYDEDNAVLQVIEKNDFVIAGISGKKCELEKEFIKKVKVNMPKDDRIKILALHTTLTENRINEFMQGIDADELPKGFDYYAFGHIHKPFKKEINGKLIVYPGPLFPNNFSELEELGNGSFFIVDIKNKQINAEKQELRIKNTVFIDIDANAKAPEIITSEIMGRIKKDDVNDKIILLKIAGTMLRGKTSDIDFKSIEENAKKANCYSMLKSTSSLESPEFKIKTEVKSENIDEIEKEIISKQKNNDFGKFTEHLIKALEIEKQEGETTLTFESRLFEEFSKVFGVKI